MSKGKGAKPKNAPAAVVVKQKRDRAAAHQRRMAKKARKGMKVERGSARAERREGLVQRRSQVLEEAADRLLKTDPELAAA